MNSNRLKRYFHLTEFFLVEIEKQLCVEIRICAVYIWQIFKTYKNTTSGSCGFYKGCDLLGQGKIDDNNENERQDCEFRCPCDGDGCEVALIDRTDEEEPVCEIRYN